LKIVAYLKAVIYARVSTEDQTPKSQLQEVLNYAESRGYEVIEFFEENISGGVDPLERPAFRKLLEYVKTFNVDVIVMYDLTRFYRASSPIEALNRLRTIMETHNILIDFAKELEIGDPLLRELWLFIKSWFSSYEKLQVSLRTHYAMARLKREGKLYHKPSIIHYYATWLNNKNLNELTRKELESAGRQLKAIVKKY